MKIDFDALFLNVNKSFGAQERVQAGIGVDNLLNDKREFIFQSYKAQSDFFQFSSWRENQI